MLQLSTRILHNSVEAYRVGIKAFSWSKAWPLLSLAGIVSASPILDSQVDQSGYDDLRAEDVARVCGNTYSTLAASFWFSFISSLFCEPIASYIFVLVALRSSLEQAVSWHR